MTTNFNNKEGMVLEIQRMSTEDGPGIRTTVFMKGCSLKCSWCHNPESISFKQQIQWIKTNCILCGICVTECPENALSIENNEILIDWDKCKICLKCTKECPTAAMETIGKHWTKDALIEELLKDEAYFKKSGGGITISGGEPGMQPDFVSSVLKSLRQKGIHTAFDTCGMYNKESLKKILPVSNIILFDIKEIDPDKHKDFTGSTNKQILENLNLINNYMKDHLYPEKLWIRTPIIPETTASETCIKAIAEYLKAHSISFDRWELCAFNNLCNNKYERLGMKWKFKNYGLFTKNEMDTLLSTAKKYSHLPEAVIWTGSVKEENKNNKEQSSEPKVIDLCRATSIPSNGE